jgi:hypothetical protein
VQLSNIPVKFSVPWANTASATYLRAIPTASQIGIVPGEASLTDGWPPLTALPVAGGGIPPDIRDANGILKQITSWDRWLQAGGRIAWDSAFSAAIGGYPFGCEVPSATTPNVTWVSTAENNVTNPDTGGAGWVHRVIAEIGYIPVNKAGDSGIGALSASSLASTGAITATGAISAGGALNAGATVNATGNVNANGGRLRAALGATGSGDPAVATILSDFLASLAVNGYQKLPSGYIIQWGEAATGNGVGVNFPLVFPNNCLGVVANESQASNLTWGAGTPTIHAIGDRTTSGFTHWTLTWNGTGFIAAGNACCYIAIGN